MKRAGDYRKLVVNFDSSKEVTRQFEKELHKILFLERKIENDCSLFFIPEERTIKVGEFDYTSRVTVIKTFKKLSVVEMDLVESYYAFLLVLKRNVSSFRKKNNLPESLWDDFINNRISLLKDLNSRSKCERTL